MHIKGRFKLIRKHDCDFWYLTYYRAAQNRFFSYFKFSLMHRVKKFGKKKHITFYNLKPMMISGLQNRRKARGYVSPFLEAVDVNLLNLKKQLNFYKLFLRRSFKFATYLYRRCYYYRYAHSRDLLLGVKSAFRIYKPLRHKTFQQTKLFFQRLTLFYNGFDRTKLKRFGRLGRKGKFGGANKFLLLLESRVDSIVLRLNLACKFIIRELILEGNILVDERPVCYLNFIVKTNSVVSFVPKFRPLIYASLFHKLPIKMFFVQPPFYLEINYRILQVVIVPKLMDSTFIPYPFLHSKSSIIAGLHTVLWGW